MAKTKLDRNQNSLLIVHMIRMVLELFTSTFLTSHIISLDPDNIFGTGLFNVAILFISQYVAYIIVYTINSYFVDKSNRVTFLRVGIFVNACFLIAIVLWGEIISHWIVFAGAICGISNAFYYSSFNVMKNEVVHRNTLKHFTILTTVITNIINVIVPVVLGLLIDISSYSTIAIYVVVIIVAQFVISFFIRYDKPKGSKLEMIKYFRYLKDNPEDRKKIKYTYYNALMAGIKTTYKIVIIILTIFAFKTNLSLGLLSSIFSVITIALLVLYRKFEDNPKTKKLLIYLSVGTLPLLTCLLFMFYTNKATFVILNCFLTIAIYFSDYYGDAERDAIIKNLNKHEFIAEHNLFHDTIKYIVSILVYVAFIIVATFESIDVFKVVLLVMIAICPFKFYMMYKQRVVRKQFEKELKEQRQAERLAQKQLEQANSSNDAK
ncbi:MAG: MFS transporter [Clostridia bacterium]|nr:MFS transporter [Clostridia bacterium]